MAAKPSSVINQQGDVGVVVAGGGDVDETTSDVRGRWAEEKERSTGRTRRGGRRERVVVGCEILRGCEQGDGAVVSREKRVSECSFSSRH